MSKKNSKNLQRVQDMVDGTYGGKIQSGYIGEANVKREVGDIWEDSEGDKWEQKKGYKMKKSDTRKFKRAIDLYSKFHKSCKFIEENDEKI